jgi:hypothetical protein
MDELKKRGMTPGKARQLLKSWQQLGANSPEELRQLLLQVTCQPSVAAGPS